METCTILQTTIDEPKSKFLKLCSSFNFNIGNTCAAVGVHRNTYYDWRASDPDFDAACESFRQFYVDVAEECLYKAIKQGNVQAAMYVTKMLGRRRGYQETVDITTAGQPVVFNLVVVRPEENEQ